MVCICQLADHILLYIVFYKNQKLPHRSNLGINMYKSCKTSRHCLGGCPYTTRLPELFVWSFCFAAVATTEPDWWSVPYSFSSSAKRRSCFWLRTLPPLLPLPPLPLQLRLPLALLPQVCSTWFTFFWGFWWHLCLQSTILNGKSTLSKTT